MKSDCGISWDKQRSGGADGAWRSSETPEEAFNRCLLFINYRPSWASPLQRFISIRVLSQISGQVGEEKARNLRKINIIATFLSIYYVKYIILFNPYNYLIGRIILFTFDKWQQRLKEKAIVCLLTSFDIYINTLRVMEEYFLFLLFHISPFKTFSLEPKYQHSQALEYRSQSIVWSLRAPVYSPLASWIACVYLKHQIMSERTCLTTNPI